MTDQLCARVYQKTASGLVYDEADIETSALGAATGYVRAYEKTASGLAYNDSDLAISALGSAPASFLVRCYRKTPSGSVYDSQDVVASTLGSGGIIIPLGVLVSKSYSYADAYDGVLIVGQSNTHSGKSVIPARDRVKNELIYANRSGSTAIVYGVDPICANAEDAGTGLVGFGTNMVKTALSVSPTFFPQNILIKDSGIGGTGFSTADLNWTPDTVESVQLYNNSVAGILALTAIMPSLYWRGIGWHQGEADNGQYTDPQYAAIIDAFIARYRLDLGIPDLPFIAGGLSPDTAGYASMTARMALIPSRNAFCGFMDPRAGGQSGYTNPLADFPDTFAGAIGISDEASIGATQDPVHFAAVTQRSYVGPRYFAGWEFAETNNNPGGSPTTPTVPATISDAASTNPQDAEVTVTLTTPSNGGAVIRGYACDLSTNGGSSYAASPSRFCGNGRKLVGLTNDQLYTARVRAFNKVGNAAWSNTFTFTPGIIYDTDAAAFFAAVTVPLSTAWKAAINTFVLGMKTDGDFAKFDVFNLSLMPDAQSSLLCMINPARSITNVGSSAFVAKGGYTFPNTNSRINVGYNPGNGGGPYKFLANDAMELVYCIGSGQSANAACGTSTTFIIPRFTDDSMRYRVNDTTNPTTNAGTVTDGSGLFITERRSSSATIMRASRNGVVLNPTTHAGTTIDNTARIYGGRTTASTSPFLNGIGLYAAGGGFGNSGLNLYNRLQTFIAAIAGL